jgi:hypothetical protein
MAIRPYALSDQSAKLSPPAFSNTPNRPEREFYFLEASF